MAANVASLSALAFLCLTAALGATVIEPAFQEQGRGGISKPLLGGEHGGVVVKEERGCLKVTPYGDTGVLSLATLSWLSPLLSVFAKRLLELTDIYLLARENRSKSCYKTMNANYERQRLEGPGKEPSLARAILRSFWKEATKNGMFAAANTLVSYVGQYLISYFVDYLSGRATSPHEGYVLASVFFAAKLLETPTVRQWHLGVLASSRPCFCQHADGGGGDVSGNFAVAKSNLPGFCLIYYFDHVTNGVLNALFCLWFLPWYSSTRFLTTS